MSQIGHQLHTNPFFPLPSILHQRDEMDEEEKERWQRPPSSYGSMRSESDDMEDRGKEEEKKAGNAVPQLPEPRAPEKTGYVVLFDMRPCLRQELLFVKKWTQVLA